MKLGVLKKLGRTLFRILAGSLTIVTILLILLAMIGQIVRDITVEWAVLMYIPLLPLGLWAILWDLLWLSRRPSHFRYHLTLLGIGLTLWGSLTMIGMGGAETDSEPTTKVTILHWNVYWGGKKGGWKPEIIPEIVQRQPDITILNETPSKSRLQFLLKKIGGTAIMYEETRRNPLAICSSWPMQFERYAKIINARAMTVIVTVHGQPLRVLAIDSKRNMSDKLVVLSRPLLPKWRTPMLSSIIKTINAYHAQRKPIDIIAGDFNAISRSRGFDEFATVGGGYHLAAKFSFDWRGTWKSYLPLYDVDHVWVHKHFQGLKAELFTNRSSDHRGQWLQFQLP